MRHWQAAFAVGAAILLACEPASARERAVRKPGVAAPSEAARSGVMKQVRGPGPLRTRDSVPLPPARPGGGGAMALPQAVPFPPPRPRDGGTPQQAPPVPPTANGTAPAESPPAPADPAQLAACHGRLTAAGARFEPLPVIDGNGECGASDAVRLDAVLMEDGARLALQPSATLRCAMAEAVVEWLRRDLAPLARELGTKPTGIAVAGSYECRGRNRQAGTRLSQHGTAAAIDVRTLLFANGTSLGFTDSKADKALRERVLGTACARFTTVLGPGSDGYHEDHIHLDAIERRNGYRICQWDVR